MIAGGAKSNVMLDTVATALRFPAWSMATTLSFLPLEFVCGTLWFQLARLTLFGAAGMAVHPLMLAVYIPLTSAPIAIAVSAK